MQAPPDYRELEDEISKVRKEKEAAIEAQQFERAASLRDREKSLLEQRAGKEREWRAEGVDLFNEVNEESIAEVLALWTGIPVYKLTEEETAKLLRMEEELHKRIVGQEDAIKAVSQAIRRTAPASRTRSARAARSSSWARPVSARPRPRRRSPSSCSVTSRR